MALALFLFVLSVSGWLHGFGAKKNKGITFQRLPDQTAIIDHPQIAIAQRPCENWEWAAALDSMLKPTKAATGQEYQILRLYGGNICTEVKSYQELAEKISHEYTLDDGRHFFLEARYSAGAPTTVAPMIVALRDKRPLLLVWKHHPYVLIGLIYDEYVAMDGERQFLPKELKLIDPEAGKSVSFVCERDNPASIDGIMEVLVKPLDLYQMR